MTGTVTEFMDNRGSLPQDLLWEARVPEPPGCGVGRTQAAQARPRCESRLTAEAWAIAAVRPAPNPTYVLQGVTQGFWRAGRITRWTTLRQN